MKFFLICVIILFFLGIWSSIDNLNQGKKEYSAAVIDSLVSAIMAVWAGFLLYSVW